MNKSLLYVIVFFVFQTALKAQSAPPFWKEIQAFKKLDSVQPIPQQSILFIGSSSFTFWKNLPASFPNYPVLNRGFGGSTLVDVTRYAYDVILPYKPKQVIIYCGENDLAASDSISAGEVVLRLKTLFYVIRTNLPTATISYVAMKPSPARERLQQKVKAANNEIKVFLKTQKRTQYINVYDAMLTKNGNLRPELYVEDQLHMNSDGYAIWQRIIAPYLIK